MDFLINANVAYLLIVAAFLLMLISIIVPGSGLPEIGFVICLTAATLLAYQLGINLWAATIMTLSILPFVVALRFRNWRIPLLGLTILLLIVGSIFLFTGKNGFPLVNPFMAIVVSLGSGLFVWLSAERAARVSHQAPAHNVDALIGKVGQARTHIHTEGTVYVGGELWSASSEKPIKVKSFVRVIRRDGLTLTVEEEQSK
jgi:membrane-bound serine protease (ClpP class)